MVSWALAAERSDDVYRVPALRARMRVKGVRRRA